MSKQRGEGVTILTDVKKPARKQLSFEILGLLAVSFLLALFLLQTLSVCGGAVVDSVISARELALSEVQLSQLDNHVFQFSLLISVVFFVVLFLFLLGERLSYIKEVVKGIHALQQGQQDYVVPLEGRNELTALAKSVNYLSATQRALKEQQQTMAEEKEQLIRTLSHDIRTPLTTILSYSEYLLQHDDCPAAERQTQLALIRQKAEQIRDLTDILLCGGKRNVERFADARLLMQQLTDELEDGLDEAFTLSVQLPRDAFPAALDIQELRRIFDNLASNIQKYADPRQSVTLRITVQDGALQIEQANAVRRDISHSESYQMGLNSIRRIAHNYAGQVAVHEDGSIFRITIKLSDI